MISSIILNQAIQYAANILGIPSSAIDITSSIVKKLITEYVNGNRRKRSKKQKRRLRNQHARISRGSIIDPVDPGRPIIDPIIGSTGVVPYDIGGWIDKTTSRSKGRMMLGYVNSVVGDINPTVMPFNPLCFGGLLAQDAAGYEQWKGTISITFAPSLGQDATGSIACGVLSRASTVEGSDVEDLLNAILGSGGHTKNIYSRSSIKLTTDGWMNCVRATNADAFDRSFMFFTDRNSAAEAVGMLVVDWNLQFRRKRHWAEVINSITRETSVTLAGSLVTMAGTPGDFAVIRRYIDLGDIHGEPGDLIVCTGESGGDLTFRLMKGDTLLENEGLGGTVYCDYYYIRNQT